VAPGVFFFLEAALREAFLRGGVMVVVMRNVVLGLEQVLLQLLFGGAAAPGRIP
jgi:hypothetical protein